MPAAHRNGDLRVCDGVTVVTGQSTVTVNGKLWAVAGDQDDHGNGQLIPSVSAVTAGGKLVIVHAPDEAEPDDLCPSGVIHCNPMTAQGSGDVFAY